MERALRRLKTGTYGKCEACSTKIPVARLNALPYSTVCIKCQREIESEGGCCMAAPLPTGPGLARAAGTRWKTGSLARRSEIDLSK